MFGKFLMHPLRQCGDLKEEHPRLVQLGSILILACQEVLNEFGPCLKLFIQIQTLPPSMQHKWKDIYEIECKTTNGKS
jgi:hypothetical protein